MGGAVHARLFPLIGSAICDVIGTCSAGLRPIILILYIHTMLLMSSKTLTLFQISFTEWNAATSTAVATAVLCFFEDRSVG